MHSLPNIPYTVKKNVEDTTEVKETPFIGIIIPRNDKVAARLLQGWQIGFNGNFVATLYQPCRYFKRLWDTNLKGK